MNVNETIQSALRNYQAGDLQQAENISKQILDVQSDHILAINLLGIIHYQLKNYDSAIQYMKKLIALNPNNAQAYYILGHSMQEKKQLDESITYYQKALQHNPDFADAYYNLGTILQDLKRHDEAISCYQKVLQINPADVDTYYNLGLVFQEKEQPDEAVTCYQKALQLNPNIADAYHNLGIILKQRGSLDEALNCFQRTLQLNPEHAGTAQNTESLIKLIAIKKRLQKENPLILEIGSHVGGDTINFLGAFRDAKIYCFEPDPRCIEKFKRNVHDKRCALIEVAVSNTDGTTLLNLSGGRLPEMPAGEEWDASSSIKKSVSHCLQYPWLTFNSSVEVKTIKLDTWVKENNINYIDFIWADVQGAERDLIEGAVHTLQITQYLQTEYGEISSYPEAMPRDETIALLRRHDFEIIPELSDTGEHGNLMFRNKTLQ